MCEHAGRVGFALRKTGQRNWLLASKIPDSSSGDLYGRFGNLRNAQDGAGGRAVRKIVRESFVELLIVIDVLEVHLDINDVIHREAHGFNDFADILETLTHLSRKISGSGAAVAVWALAGDINIVAGVETAWSETNGRCRFRSTLREHGCCGKEHADNRQ